MAIVVEGDLEMVAGGGICVGERVDQDNLLSGCGSSRERKRRGRDEEKERDQETLICLRECHREIERGGEQVREGGILTLKLLV